MFDAAKPFTPIYLYKLSLWSLWINRWTFPLRLVMVWLGIWLTGLSPDEMPGEEPDSLKEE